MKVILSKQEKRKFFSEYWCTKFPESFFIDENLACYLKGESIISKNQLIFFIIHHNNTDMFLNKMFKKFLNNKLEYGCIDNDDILSFIQKNIKYYPDYKNLSKKIKIQALEAKRKYELNFSKKDIIKAKKILKSKGFKVVKN